VNPTDGAPGLLRGKGRLVPIRFEQNPVGHHLTFEDSWFPEPPPSPITPPYFLTPSLEGKNLRSINQSSY